MEATNIHSLFSTTTQFVIPSYQRAYSWGKDQREQFIQDLRDANNRYYLGHFLFEKVNEKDGLNLIDGQQRLTTVVIFFSCLCEEFRKRAACEDSELMTTRNRLHHVYIRDSFTNRRHFKTVYYDDAFF